jgi:diaminopimelate epimerase
VICRRFGRTIYYWSANVEHLLVVEGLEDYDVVGEGRAIRYGASQLLPVGVNVNFIEPGENGVLKVRTYEKGVEDETYACGTGIVASCIAAYKAGIKPTRVSGRDVLYEVKAKRDNLLVCFRPQEDGNGIATEVYLTGPAVLVAEISVWL